MNASEAKPPAEMPTVQVSWGELIDKITILEIKEQRFTSPRSVANVRNELASLNQVVQNLQPRATQIDAFKAKLKSVNETLWDVEDRIRIKEAAKAFDQQFIELARLVYFNNDERARIKRGINELLNSEFVEEKQYIRYEK